MLFKGPRKSLLFYCKLFGTVQNSFITGVNDWKHASEYIYSHEWSPNHSCSINIFFQSSTKKDRIDTQSPEMFENKFKYTKNVLHRVVNVVKFLATRCLAFRGSEEAFYSETNRNYLGIIEFISQYDTFLSEHLVKHGN